MSISQTWNLRFREFNMSEVTQLISDVKQNAILLSEICKD